MFEKMDILKLFFEFSTKEFNTREVARCCKISPSTASKDLKYLAKKNVLSERKERMLNLYKANLDSDIYRDMKIFYNIRKIKDSGLLNAINEFYLKPSVIIFGSCAFGMDTETSDIDILVISENKKPLENMKQLEKALKKEIQIIVVKDLKELKNKHLINNILNGIVIQGDVKWI